MRRFAFTICLLITITFCFFCSKSKHIKSGAYTYETVKGDPLNARLYTLDNGLNVYMTVYKDAPRIQVAIPVRVGSKNDPSETTGLAHYLEHLLFKGSNEFGTVDFEKENVLLDQITSLFETYRQESDTLRRKEIYAKIDSISFAASKLAIAGEYDKMLALIGANGTNAFTGNDMTVYINDIPANQIKQWLTIESERFRDPVFRLFHTELEVVYEEKNRSMDNDGNKIWEALNKGLYAKHPYGTQTTLGEPEHLKNPSIQNVYDYYHKWYVPGNMAICLSGDFDPDSMITMIDKTFGTLEVKECPEWNPPVENPITTPIIKEVLGPDMESVTIGFRFPGVTTPDAELLLLTDWLMMNGVAGIIDLNLMQKQRVINPSSGTDIMKDYSAHIFRARPREGQTLEEVKNLLLAQIDSLKAGKFPDWLPTAAVQNLKLHEIRNYESNWGRAFGLAEAFYNGMEWQDVVSKWDRFAKITKQDIVNFANTYYGDNYVVVYKRTGEDPNVTKIKKPQITPIELNRDAQSEFVKTISNMPAPEIKPVFIDFNNDMERFFIKTNIPVHYKKNIENQLFDMNYIVDMGNNNNKKLGLALEYLNYLGTSKYSPEEFKQELYKIGCSFGAWTSDDQLRVYLSGLADNYEKGVELFEHLLQDAQPNQEALENLIKDTLKKRADAKLSKGTILRGAMYNYGVYGKTSPFQNILTEEELYNISTDELVDMIKKITTYPHRILYYGPLEKNSLVAKIELMHNTTPEFVSIPEPQTFEQLDTRENKVFVCNYDMKQAEIIMISKSVPFSKDNIALKRLFNEYYGGNMSSVVFQTLRESKALAYSVYGSYQTPNRPDEAHYIYSYIGTQADKLSEAMEGMFDLLNNMAKSDISFQDSKNAIIKQIQTERITKNDILFRYESEHRMGMDDHDYREDVYEQVPELSIEKLEQFFNEYIKDKNYTILVLGDVNKLDFNLLKKFGQVKQLSLEEVFGY